jgi:hypothetical protein
VVYVVPTGPLQKRIDRERGIGNERELMRNNPLPYRYDPDGK